MADERRAIELARSQHGLLSRAQAGHLGFTRGAIGARLESGAWSVVRRGVYAVGAAPVTWERSVAAACLAGGSDVIAGRLTAARVWSLIERSGRIEVLVGSHRRVRLERVRVHRSILLPAQDRTVHRDIPVTTLSRTLADASSKQDPATVGVWIDRAMRMHGLNLHDLRSCLARLAGPGRRDVRSVRDALAARLPGYDPGDSELEVRAMRALARAGLPAPVQQHPVARPDGSTALLDLAYPWAMIAIELDGWEHHGLRSAFDRDRMRRDELTLLGWAVYQFTSTMSDAYLVDIVGQALATRQHDAAG